jgi:hypothetical protein
MDLLNILDDFLYKKSLNLNEIVRELNLFNDFEKIAQKYRIPPDILMQKLHEAGYEYNESTKKWSKNSIEENNSIENRESNFVENKIDIDSIVTNLNKGTSVHDIANNLGISQDDLLSMLQRNGYRFYDFAELWSKLNEKELVSRFVEQLNNGLTVFDLSQKYVKNRHARTRFANKVFMLLNKYQYTYNENLNKWLPNVDKGTIAREIVSLLNDGKEFQEIERIYGMNDTNIRILLKEYNYRYDYIYDIWTNKSLKQLLQETSEELIANNQTWDDFLRKNRISKEMLYKKLKEFHIDRPPISEQSKKTVDKFQSSETRTVTSSVSESNTPEFSNNQSLPLLSNEEISALKQIVKEWKELYSLDKEEVSFIKVFLPKNLVDQLENYCESNNITKSQFIRELLEKKFTEKKS